MMGNLRSETEWHEHMIQTAMPKLWQKWQFSYSSGVSHSLFLSCEQDCASMCCYTLTFLALGVVCVFSVLFFLFLTLLCLTLLTVRVMLVGVCWVAVYDTAEADMSSSPLSVALLSPTVKADINQAQDPAWLTISTWENADTGKVETKA